LYNTVQLMGGISFAWAEKEGVGRRPPVFSHSDRSSDRLKAILRNSFEKRRASLMGRLGCNEYLPEVSLVQTSNAEKEGVAARFALVRSCSQRLRTLNRRRYRSSAIVGRPFTERSSYRRLPSQGSTPSTFNRIKKRSTPEGALLFLIWQRLIILIQ
jgi:hypothetical protein